MVGWAKADFPVEESVDKDVSMGDICIGLMEITLDRPRSREPCLKDGEPYLMANPDSKDLSGSTTSLAAHVTSDYRRKSLPMPTGNVVVKSQVGTHGCFTGVSLTALSRRSTPSVGPQPEKNTQSSLRKHMSVKSVLEL